MTIELLFMTSRKTLLNHAFSEFYDIAIGGRYHLLRKLGSVSFDNVYLGMTVATIPSDIHFELSEGSELQYPSSSGLYKAWTAIALRNQ